MTMLVTSGTENRAGAMAWTRETKADWPDVRLENSHTVTAINAVMFYSVSVSLLRGKRNHTGSRDGQKNWKGNDEPAPPVDDPKAVNLRPTTHR